LRQLAAGASAADPKVRLHLAGDPDQVPTSTAAVVYRIVQEGVTNALKHSPGAPIVIVDVLNGSGTVPISDLDSAGGGRGLTGVQDRVSALGGAFTAGPEPGGAWRISVRLRGS